MGKIAISNIAWTGNNEQVFELLAGLGVGGIEVAPGKVNNGWDALNANVMGNYRKACDSFGLVIPSFQAFLYGKPELQLLGDKQNFAALKQHMKFVSELADVAGAKVLVFGAPKNRLILSHSYEDALKLAEERLAALAEICWQYKVSIGLESVPQIYGGEIITSYKESAHIVAAVSHPGLVFHLDTGCTFLNGDSISQAIERNMNSIAHLHISQPKLSDFSEPADYHCEAAKALNAAGYDSWRCIEMLETEKSSDAIRTAVNFINEKYSHHS
ncbi:sugar phosphate isomerase/epimerase family protein [Zobellella sp. An-6]|uniref:sugar phosphate isomerase/epimerase family protein n=1 Tax=Zobellella sp. An-6 TaxID=3400218 RepID=UPI004043916F